MKPLIDIVVVVKEENKYLFECLDKCLKLDYTNYIIRIFPDNKPSQRLIEYKKQSRLIIKPTGPKNIPEKRNIAVKETTSEYIAFIDSDAFPDKNWLKNAVPLFKNKKILAVGGPNLTPDTDTFFQKITGNVMKLKFGFGKGYIRQTKSKKQYINELPTCNLIVRYKAFEKIRFDETLETGEDTKFCYDIIKNGYKILYSPKVIVYHHRKKSFLPFMNQMFNYGLFNGKLYKDKKVIYKYYVLPCLFFIFVITGFVSSLFSMLFRTIFLAVMSIYFFIITIETIIKVRLIEIPFTVLSAFMAHLSYGCSFLLGYLFK